MKNTVIETNRDGRELLGYAIDGYGYWLDKRDLYVYQTTPTGEWNGYFAAFSVWESKMHHILDPRCAKCGISKFSIQFQPAIGSVPHLSDAACCLQVSF